MTKRKDFQYPMRQRIDSPKITKDREGNAILMCPFCNPSHALNLESGSSCGSEIQVRVVQTVYKAKYSSKLICVKCGLGGGEMVKFQNGFVHTHKCKPGVMTLETPPTYTRLAEFIYKFTPEWFRKKVGAIEVQEIFPDGTKTGVILGYAFFRSK